MGKLKLFTVTFSNGQGKYLAGQIIHGDVVIELAEPMDMRGILLKLLGEGRVEWTESASPETVHNRNAETRTYRRSECYIDTELLLAGRWKHDSGQDIRLPAGHHSFPFAFQLPTNIPSSYEATHGYVRYNVLATIDKPWKFDDVTECSFKVFSLLDLNREPSAALPAQSFKSKAFCCLCCASGPVSVTLAVQRRGYIPGEVIPIRAEIDNKSNKRLVRTSVVMKQKTTYHAEGRHKTETESVASVLHGEIPEGETEQWLGDQIVVPPVPPSYLKGCNIIDIKYDLELRVTPSGLGSDLTVPLEIIIGDMPVQKAI